MRNVKNKKCIDNLCKKSIYANVRRNVILAFAIMLSTIMLTTLFTIGGSIIKSVQDSTMYQVGTNQHAGFKFMTQEDYDLLKEDPKISNLTYNIIVGIPVSEELIEDYTEIRYTTEGDAKASFSYPEVGRLPEAENELATCTKVLDDFGVPYEIGQTITLRISNGHEEYEGEFVLSGYWEKPTATMANQIYVSRAFQEKFTPEWKTYEDKESALDHGIYAGSINTGFNFPTTVDIDGQMDELCARIPFGHEMNGGTNWAYMTTSVDPTSVIIVAFLLLLIIGSGYLIIYNIFYIAVSSDIRYYGLLKTVGTTDKQLKRLILKQATMLAVIAIPVGMLIGYFVSMVLFPVITESVMDIPCKVSVNVWVFVLSAFFSWVTIRISCIKPCRVIKKISPVEAVRYSEYTGTNLSSKKKTRKVTPASMAWENLKRNKKKSFVVVLSLALSVLMINVTVSITSSFDENKYVSNFANSDICVQDATVMNRNLFTNVYDGVSDEDIEYFESFDGITECGAIYMSECFEHMDEIGFDRLTAMYEEHPEWFMYSMDEKEDFDYFIYEEKSITSHIYGVDRIVFDKMDIESGDMDWEKFQTGKYVIVSSAVTSDDDDTEYSFYRVGEKVNVDFPDGTSAEYEVMAIGDVDWAMGPEHTHSLDVYFTIPADEYRNHVDTAGALKYFINADEEKLDTIEEAIAVYCEEDKPELGYTSRKIFLEDFKEMIGMFLLVGGLLSGILALIGILNFINLTYTSIHERKKELDVLRAIGMTRKQQKGMLVGEGLIHILLTFALVLTVGTLLNYLIVNAIAGGMMMFSYRFVIWPVLACIPVFAAVAAAVPAAVIKTK